LQCKEYFLFFITLFLIKEEVVKGMLHSVPIRKQFIFVLFLIVLSSPYTTPEQKSSPSDHQIVLQLKWKNQFQFAGYYAAKLKGYYRDAGLDVNIVPGNEKTNVVTEVVSGRAQFGVGVPDVLLQGMQGSPLIIVASIFQHSPAIIVSKENKNIQIPSDLVGKRIGVVEKNAEAQIKSILIKEGISLDSATFVQSTGSIEELLTDKVDALEAYITSTPFVLKKRGINFSLIRPDTYGVDFYGDLLFTSKNELQNNYDEVAAFRNASIKGWEYALNHPEELIAAILKMQNLDTLVDKEFLENESKEIEKLIVPHFVEIGHNNFGRWQAIADNFTQLGMHKGDHDLMKHFFRPRTIEREKWLEIVFIVASVLLVLTLLVAFWIYELRRLVKKRTEELTKEVEQREKSEAELQKKEASLRAIYDSAQQVHFLIDKDGNVLSYNRKAKEYANKILGREANLLGKSFVNFLPEANRKNFLTYVQRCLHGEKFNYEQILHWENFPPLWFELLFLPVYDENQKLVGVSLNGIEISSKKKTERNQLALYKISAAVNASGSIENLYKNIHEILKTLMPADNIFICLINEEDNSIEFPYFVDEYDEAPERQPFTNFEKSLTAYVLRERETVLADAKTDLELQQKGILKLVGEPAKIWLGAPLKVNDTVIGVIALQDYHNEKTYGEPEKQILTFVSEQIGSAIDKKKKEEELIKFAEELKSLNANKDRLFSIIAHDLRSPFLALLGLGEILANEIDNLTLDEIKRFSSELYTAINVQYKFLENLLEWSRLQLGKVEFNPAKVNLHENVLEVFNRLTGTAVRKNIKLINETKETDHVLSDENILQSILHNLIFNAIKFTNENGEIKVLCKKDGNMNCIGVKDNGVGIAQEDVSKLFLLPHQFSTRGTANEKGTGLGLLICRELVEKHERGKIWVESELGVGTTFWFCIPSFED